MQKLFKLPMISDRTVSIPIDRILQDKNLWNDRFCDLLLNYELISRFGLHLEYHFDSKEAYIDSINKIIDTAVRKQLTNRIFREFAPIFSDELLSSDTVYAQIFLVKQYECEFNLKVKRISVRFDDFIECMEKDMQMMYDAYKPIPHSFCMARLLCGTNSINGHDMILYRKSRMEDLKIKVPQHGDPSYTVPTEAAFASNAKMTVLTSKIKILGPIERHGRRCIVPLSPSCQLDII